MDNSITSCDFCIHKFHDSEKSFEIDKIAVICENGKLIRFTKVLEEISFSKQLVQQLKISCEDCTNEMLHFFMFKNSIQSRKINQVVELPEIQQDEIEFFSHCIDLNLVWSENFKSEVVGTNVKVIKELKEEELLVEITNMIENEDIQQSIKIADPLKVNTKKRKRGRRSKKSLNEAKKQRILRECTKKVKYSDTPATSDQEGTNVKVIKEVKEEELLVELTNMNDDIQQPVKFEDPLKVNTKKRKMRRRSKKSLNDTPATSVKEEVVSKKTCSDSSFIAEMSLKLNKEQMKIFTDKVETTISQFYECCDCKKILKSRRAVEYHISHRHILSEISTEKIWVSNKLQQGKISENGTFTWKCCICDRICQSHPSLRYHLSLHWKNLRNPEMNIEENNFED